MNRPRDGAPASARRVANGRFAPCRRPALRPLHESRPGDWGGPGLEAEVKSPSAPNPRVSFPEGEAALLRRTGKGLFDSRFVSQFIEISGPSPNSTERHEGSTKSTQALGPPSDSVT